MVAGLKNVDLPPDRRSYLCAQCSELHWLLPTIAGMLGYGAGTPYFLGLDLSISLCNVVLTCKLIHTVELATVCKHRVESMQEGFRLENEM
jgi:hypothetical protein